MPNNQPLEALIDAGVSTAQDGPRGAAPPRPPSQIAASRRNALKSTGPRKRGVAEERAFEGPEPPITAAGGPVRHCRLVLGGEAEVLENKAGMCFGFKGRKLAGPFRRPMVSPSATGWSEPRLLGA
jgi:hypothetical protein